MNFQFFELPDSGATTRKPPSKTLRFKAVGEVNESKVELYAVSGTPGVLYTPTALLYRQDIRITPDGWQQFIVDVPYGPRATEGSTSFSFDTTGGTVRIKAARQHIASYPYDGANPNPHAGAISVTEDRDVEGTDVVIPAMKLSYTFRHQRGVVNEIFAKQMYRATGAMNAFRFRSSDPGELLFLGASGSDGSEAEAEVTYHMAYSPNLQGLTFGGIEGIAKRGHDYLWIEFRSDFSGGIGSVQPKRVHVERVYEAINYAAVFGWS